MTPKTIETNVVEAFGREFVQGNVPEINEVRCLGCSHCVVLCKKLGPNVFDLKEGIAVVARPDSCIGDGACMMACPTKAIFLMSHPTGKKPTPL